MNPYFLWKPKNTYISYGKNNKKMEKNKKFRDYGEIDFEDHEIEQAEERYEKVNEELGELFGLAE